MVKRGRGLSHRVLLLKSPFKLEDVVLKAAHAILGQRMLAGRFKQYRKDSEIF